MPKFEKVEKGLYRHVQTGIYYVRKFRRGKGEITRSTGKMLLTPARKVAEQILSDWLKDEDQSIEVLFDEPAFEVLGIMTARALKTYQDFETHLRLHILPFYSGVPLEEVGGLWEKYVADKKGARPDRKLLHDQKHIKRILRYASRQKKFQFSVVPELPLPDNENSPAQHKEYSNSEISAISVKALEKGRHRKTKLKLDLLLRTGMRDNERRLLKYEYIDQEKGLITLPPDVCKNRDGRTYDLPEDLLKRILTLKNPFRSAYVFPHRWKKFKGLRSEGPSSKGWQQIRDEVGLKRRKKHFFRSTYATRAIRGGAPAILVQKSLGMSDTVMKRIYVQANDADVKKMSRLVGESFQVET